MHGKWYTIPTRFDAITLGQYIAYYKAQSNIEKCAAALSCPIDEAKGIQLSHVKQIVDAFEIIITSQVQTHHKLVTINGTEYGFIPSLELISAGEFADIDTYNQLQVAGNYDALLNMAAVLYRPIKRKIGGHYQIVPYSVDSPEYQQALVDLKELSIADMLGAMVFFCNAENDLQRTTLRSLMDLTNELKREQGNQR